MAAPYKNLFPDPLRGQAKRSFDCVAASLRDASTSLKMTRLGNYAT
jgi:hypothetical protein